MRSIVIVLVVALAAAAGLGVGLGVAAECPSGPVPGLVRAAAGLLIGGVAVVLVLLGVLVAAVRRSMRGGMVLVVLATGLAGGFIAGLLLGSPNCPSDPTVAVDGTASVELDAPYGNTHQGSVACHIDRATSGTVDVTGGTNRSDPPEWQTSGLGLNFTLTTDRTSPPRSASFELVLSQANREWGYRSNDAAKLDLQVDGRQGTLAFTAVPLVDDTRRDASPVPSTLAGQLSWSCDAP